VVALRRDYYVHGAQTDRRGSVSRRSAARRPEIPRKPAAEVLEHGYCRFRAYLGRTPILLLSRLMREHRRVGVLDAVTIGSLRLERFESVLAPDRYEAVRLAAERAGQLLEGRVVWNVNSTARGGGVAEMLISLLAYARGAGVDARWMVIPGSAPFFALTKRIHNNLHSAQGDGGDLGDAERELYEQALEPSVAEFAELVDRRDVVIIHDPQPAGLIPRLKEIGVAVIWRCHVGIDHPSVLSRRAWSFLRPMSSRPTRTCSRVRRSSGTAWSAPGSS
jgi:hypothetical protein